jgi:hypothetical protein
MTYFSMKRRYSINLPRDSVVIKLYKKILHILSVFKLIFQIYFTNREIYFTKGSFC